MIVKLNYILVTEKAVKHTGIEPVLYSKASHNAELYEKLTI